jgi:hypothetical protein
VRRRKTDTLKLTDWNVDMLSLPLRLRFGSDGDYLPWAFGGWSGDPDDRTHTWTEGYVAKLKLPLDSTSNDRLLIVDVIPHQSRGQDLFLFVNGSFATFWSVRHAVEVTAPLESNLFKAGDNIFAFVTPKAVRPSDESAGDDERLLGCAFRSLALMDM